jgi:hypothetical protein
MAALTHVGTRTEAPTPPPPPQDDEFSSESDLELGQDYAPPPPLPPWPRGASTKPQTPRRHKALDKLRLGHELTSYEVVRALLGNDLLRAVPTDIKRSMEYSGAEIRVVGLLWRGGGDEEEVDDEDPLQPDEWLPREVLAYPPLLELPREQIMRIKQKLDAQARSDAIELGMQYPEPDEDSEVLEKLRAARLPEIVRKKHPEFDTEFDPVKVVRQAELDRLEKVSLEYREKERFLRPSHEKEDVVEAIQRVAAPRKSHNKPLRPPPPRPLKKEYPFRIGPPAFSRTQAMHEDISKRPAPSGDPADNWLKEIYGEDEEHVLRLAANQPANINFEWKDGALIIVGFVDEEAEARAQEAGGVLGARLASVNGVSLQGHGRESVMRRMRSLASVARRLGFAAPAAEASQWHKPTGEAEPPAEEASQWHKPTGGPSETAPAGPADEEHRPPADAIPAGLFARPTARPRLCVLKYVDANANKRDLPAKTKERTKKSHENEYRCLRDLVPLLREQSIYTPRVLACVEIKLTAHSSRNRSTEPARPLAPDPLVDFYTGPGRGV